jgi:hypothetical protein
MWMAYSQIPASGQAGGGDADGVEHRRRHLVGGRAQQRRRIEQEGDAAEEEQVQQDQGPVQALDAAEQLVVADPEQPDHGEAEGEPGHPGDGLPQLGARLQVGHVGDLKVDDQQGDGDGEDGVAEEQDAVVLDRLGPGQGTPAAGTTLVTSVAPRPLCHHTKPAAGTAQRQGPGPAQRLGRQRDSSQLLEGPRHQW